MKPPPPANDLRSASGGRGPRHVYGYLNDPVPVAGPATLLRQMQAVDDLAGSSALALDGFVVDSGSALTAAWRGSRLQAFIDRTDRRRGDVLIIDGTRSLARDVAAAFSAIADLLEAGIILKDASGELHPSETAISLAREAAVERGAGCISRRPAGGPAKQPVARRVARRAASTDKRDAAARQPGRDGSCDAV